MNYFTLVSASFVLPSLGAGKRTLDNYWYKLFSCTVSGTEKLSLGAGEYSLPGKRATLRTWSYMDKRKMRTMR